MSEKLKSETPVVRPRLVRRFELMNRIGEHEWEEACGPFETYEEAEKARLNWSRKDEIPRMRVVEFYPPNAELTYPESKNPAVEGPSGKGLSVQRLVRPDCDNCGDPATYRAYHGEGGGVYVCEDCMRAHSRDHTQVRTIWPNVNVELPPNGGSESKKGVVGG